MKFSVLMSVYYKENPLFFDEALRSIMIEQTIIPDEFVLVCDGALNSELNCIIEKYYTLFPEIVKVYRLETNVGLGKALAYGLEKCTYEVVARADSDDVCDKYRFEKQIRFIEEHKEVSAVGSDIDEFNDNYENPIRFKHMPQDFSDIKKVSRYRNPINHMTVMFYKTPILSVGSYIDLPFVEDYYLWVRLIAHGYVITNIREVLVHARVGNGMVKRRGNKKYISSWKVLNQYKLACCQINRFEYIINLLLVRMFVYLPSFVKNITYKRILRN